MIFGIVRVGRKEGREGTVGIDSGVGSGSAMLCCRDEKPGGRRKEERMKGNCSVRRCGAEEGERIRNREERLGLLGSTKSIF